jgi:anti-sigma regulatory factor (Ser/Thr protein kinase)
MYNHIMSASRVRALVDRRGEVANRNVAAALKVSPATSHRWLRALVAEGALERHGRGRAARYRLPRIRHRFPLAGLEEDRVWHRLAEDIERVRPMTVDEGRSLQYAASEIINNAIEHSSGRSVAITISFEADRTTVTTVRDDGVGVFRRVCADFGFGSPQEAIVQLEKGKLTSDPARHSGEGLFFSSKAVARFRLESQGIAWVVDNLVGDSGIGASNVQKGTEVALTVVSGRTPRLETVFRAYTDPEALRFTRTRTTIRLSALGSTLISRSEARRVVQRLTEFTHATLDFSGVDVVGQGFCDEVFRVFARNHPEVTLEPVGMNDAVAFMVARARAT